MRKNNYNINNKLVYKKPQPLIMLAILEKKNAN